jgi:transposase/5-methylcytosine-specific restriction endonuclease McrA
VLCPHNGIATGQARRRQKPSHPIDTFCGVPYVKYTREVLAAAVAASTSMAGVLRHLGLGQNGGSHTHLRRRIDRLGIDTGHFLGRAHYRGSVSPRRRSPSEILVVRPAGAKRAAPQVLRRALVAQGRAYRCAECGVSDSWNGRPLTLQIDHIDGRYWDCRPDNLRFLCPNCHSQTSTYAGRNRPRLTIAVVRVDENGDTVEDGSWPGPRTEEEKLAVLDRVERGELTVSDAARLLGCHRNYVYQLRRRLAERGTLAAAPRPAGPPDAIRQEIVAFALRNSHLGARRISAALADREVQAIAVAHGTVAKVLLAAGLNTATARRLAASGDVGRGRNV